MYDLVVIGGGSAGLTAAIVGGRVGAKTLLVDKKRLGGDCTYYGCVPSKALIKCAKVAHQTSEADRYGVKVAGAEVSWPDVMKYVWDVVAEVAAGETPEVLAEHGVEVAFGGARFDGGPHRIRVGEERVVEARNVILCVGSHSFAPSIAGLDEVGFIDHVSVFHLEQLPARLAVIGGGPIGVELGQSLARLGSKVTLLQRGPRLLTKDDAELSEMLTDHLRKEIDIVTDAKVARCEAAADSKVVIYDVDGDRRALPCDEILVAVGRRASLDGLGLEEAGIEVKDGRVAIDQHLATTASGVYAAGDCASQLLFTHYASAQARVAARNALFRFEERFEPSAVPWCTFSDPELAHCGLTEEQAREQDHEIRVYRHGYDHVDRAITDGVGWGMAKVVCQPKGKILGASLLGPMAGEAIASFVTAIEEGLSLQDLGRHIIAYPSMNRVVGRLADRRFFEEGINSWVRKLFGRY